MSKHFCCCVPVRFGVFILSLLSLLGSAGTAAVIWFVIIKGPEQGLVLQGGVKTGLIIAAAVYTVFALISLFGFLGAIIRSRGLVKTYSAFLWIQLLLTLAMGIFFAISLFKDSFRSTLLDTCIQRLTELQNSLPAASRTQTPQQIQDGCAGIFKQSRVGFIISFCISFLINLYCCIIVHRYGTQLTEEQQYKGDSHAMGQTYAGKDAPRGYYPHTPLTNVEGGYGYPYAQKEHGFGGSNH